jgi:hypothetical protein
LCSGKTTTQRGEKAHRRQAGFERTLLEPIAVRINSAIRVSGWRRWEFPIVALVQYSAMFNINQVLQHLQQERASLASQLERLNSALSALNVKGPSPRGHISAAGRARIAAAQRARWAKVKGRKVVPLTTRKISLAARKRIAAAQKARWATWRKAQKTA